MVGQCQVVGDIHQSCHTVSLKIIGLIPSGYRIAGDCEGEEEGYVFHIHSK